MAPEKKPKKKEDSGGGGLDASETVIMWLIILLLIGTFLERFSGTATTAELVDTGASWIQIFFRTHLLPGLKIFSFTVSILAFAGILWSIVKLRKVSEDQNELYSIKESSSGDEDSGISLEVKNKKWEKVLTHINSINQNDWKFAILEADIILDELLSTMAYHGETMADKLKSVEKSDFNTIELAWEAHKVRNVIAHEGSDYLITEREARRVIGLYKTIFEEFKII
jgi:hypothetical protein